MRLATSTTTKAFDEDLDGALKNLYASVRAFLDKAEEYFVPGKSGIVPEQFFRLYQLHLTGFVYSGEKDCQPLEAVFGHYATSDPRHFGQGKSS